MKRNKNGDKGCKDSKSYKNTSSSSPLMIYKYVQGVEKQTQKLERKREKSMKKIYCVFF